PDRDHTLTFEGGQRWRIALAADEWRRERGDGQYPASDVSLHGLEDPTLPLRLVRHRVTLPVSVGLADLHVGVNPTTSCTRLSSVPEIRSRAVDITATRRPREVGGPARGPRSVPSSILVPIDDFGRIRARPGVGSAVARGAIPRGRAPVQHPREALCRHRAVRRRRDRRTGSEPGLVGGTG